jgi:hypothetical protein
MDVNKKENAKLRLQLTDDPLVKRLRLVTVGAMLFSMFNTLAGQPAKFWLNSEKAIRGDGLGLHNPLNHTFEFFLSRGWQPYMLSCLVYLALAFVAVSVLPRKAALVTCLSFIFGHFYGACQWLAVRWHMGFNGVALYGLLLSAAIAWAVSPIPGPAGKQMIRRLRWVMFAVMLVDPLVTLIGQPASYWAHPETVFEGNPLWHSFMIRGWYDYILADLAYCLGAFWMASTLPRFYAVTALFAFTFGHFLGGSNWFFYVWRMGMEAPVIYGIMISSVMVFVASRRNEKSSSMVEQSSARVDAAKAACC